MANPYYEVNVPCLSVERLVFSDIIHAEFVAQLYADAGYMGTAILTKTAPTVIDRRVVHPRRSGS